MINEELLKNNLTAIKSITTTLKMKCSDDKILEQAMAHTISEFIQVNRDKKPEQRQEAGQGQTQGTSLASDKQKSFLATLGYTGSFDLTMAEASALIKEYKGGAKNERQETNY
jgi:hypothetical protein